MLIEASVLLHALWHPLSTNGASLYGGILGDLGEVTLIGTIAGSMLAAYRHVNCEHPGCPWPGHRHPDHGRPVCRRHYHSPEADPRPTKPS